MKKTTPRRPLSAQDQILRSLRRTLRDLPPSLQSSLLGSVGLLIVGSLKAAQIQAHKKAAN